MAGPVFGFRTLWMILAHHGSLGGATANGSRNARPRTSLRSTCSVPGQWTAAAEALDQHNAIIRMTSSRFQSGHLMDFYRANARDLRDSIARVLRNGRRTCRAISILLGMHAFGLEETGDYGRAEDAGRRAVDLQPLDCWAHHAVAHVIEMQGRAEDGIGWMIAREQHWSGGDNFFKVHNWWHRSLYHLDLGRSMRSCARMTGQSVRTAAPSHSTWSMRRRSCGACISRAMMSALIWAWCRGGATSPARSTIPAASRSAGGSSGPDAALRRRRRHAHALSGQARAQGLGTRRRPALDHAQGADRARRRLAIIMHAMLRHGTEFKAGVRGQEANGAHRAEHCPREGVGDGAGFCRTRSIRSADCGFNQDPAPSRPHQVPWSTQRTQAPKGSAPPLRIRVAAP